MQLLKQKAPIEKQSPFLMRLTSTRFMVLPLRIYSCDNIWPLIGRDCNSPLLSHLRLSYSGSLSLFDSHEVYFMQAMIVFTRPSAVKRLVLKRF